MAYIEGKRDEGAEDTWEYETSGEYVNLKYVTGFDVFFMGSLYFGSQTGYSQ